MPTEDKANCHSARGGWHTAGKATGARKDREALQATEPWRKLARNSKKERQVQSDPNRHALSSQSPSSEGCRLLTVLIADDHPLVRGGLAALICQQPDMRVVAEAANGVEALEQFSAHRPDITLLDLRMPVMDGVEAIIAICGRQPTARIIILTSYESEEEIYRVVKAGARGYILKDMPVKELLECIRAVGEGRTWIPSGIGAKLAKRVAVQELTARETDVLRAMAQGKSNKEIGVELHITESTVKVHVTHLLEKLKASGRTEATTLAVRRGLVPLDAAGAV